MKYLHIVSIGKVQVIHHLLIGITFQDTLDIRINYYQFCLIQNPLLLLPITLSDYFSIIFLIFLHKLLEFYQGQTNQRHFRVSKNCTSNLLVLLSKINALKDLWNFSFDYLQKLRNLKIALHIHFCSLFIE